MKKFNFGNISIEELLDFFKITQSDKMLNLSSADSKIDSDINSFLQNLINKNRDDLEDYLEEELKMLFIAPILNLVDFRCNDFRAWLERDLNLKLEEKNIELFGKPDFMVAKGKFKPEEPFFFLQEYKKSLPNGNPKWQLIAEMIVSILKNKNNNKNSDEVFGTYIIGQYWHFVKLKEIDKFAFEFEISESFDSLKIEDLQKIYFNLQAIKKLYCEV